MGVEELRINWDYYAPRTDHTFGSSLGPAVHAWAACRLGEPEEAYTHFMQAFPSPTSTTSGNARDGIHAASAGGLWQALAFGFGGLRAAGDTYTVHPHLPRAGADCPSASPVRPPVTVDLHQGASSGAQASTTLRRRLLPR